MAHKEEKVHVCRILEELVVKGIIIIIIIIILILKLILTGKDA